MVALSSLVHYEKNARRHPEDQLVALTNVIRDSGFTAPLVIDPENGIIAGHGRALAAKRLGMAEVPCIRVSGLTPAQIKGLRLSDNALGLRGEWDEGRLLDEIKGLLGDGFDAALTGFTPEALGGFKVPGFGVEERVAAAEETPAPPANPVVRAGELWLLGDHRLIIGDSTDAKTVEKLLAGAKPHLMVTDPPYGVNYDPTWRGKVTGQKVRASGKVLNDDRADWRQAWALFPGAAAYVWHSALHSAEVQQSLESTGLSIRSQIIWVKDRFALSRGHYHWRHEPCWYAVREGKSAIWSGGRKKDTIWRISGLPPRAATAVLQIVSTAGTEETVWEIPMTVDDGSTGHGTQKPIECMRRPILNNSKPSDAVYEPFCGSGTTLIACEMEGRRCFAIELDLAYAEVIIRRWEGFTNRTATREDGKTLADLSKPKRKGAG